jgi:hypothetical protein
MSQHTENLFLLSWDMLGLETVVNISAIEKDATWALLQNKPGPKLSSIVNPVMMRARYNSQRHYEVYTITVSDGINEDDLRTMFEENPQHAAELIRKRGRKIYSDRIEAGAVKIT